MGKLILFCAVLAGAFSARAHFPIYVDKTSADDGLLKVGWSPVQFSVLPDTSWQLVSGAADVYGVAVGLLAVHQHSAVLSASLFNQVEDNYLLSLGAVEGSNRNFGIGVGLFNMIERNYGVSVGLFNFEDGFGYRSDKEPWPMIPGVQIGFANLGGGVQVGVVNGGDNSAWLQLGLFNFNDEGWLQIGLMNFCMKSGIQIGLLNHNQSAAVPWLPLFNYSWGKECR